VSFESFPPWIPLSYTLGGEFDTLGFHTVDDLTTSKSVRVYVQNNDLTEDKALPRAPAVKPGISPGRTRVAGPDRASS
jgi:hypothetical protein